ncbi:hypothetical protein AAC387_Pa09g2367 [Persea americana]
MLFLFLFYYSLPFPLRVDLLFSRETGKSWPFQICSGFQLNRLGRNTKSAVRDDFHVVIIRRSSCKARD